MGSELKQLAAMFMSTIEKLEANKATNNEGIMSQPTTSTPKPSSKSPLNRKENKTNRSSKRKLSCFNESEEVPTHAIVLWHSDQTYSIKKTKDLHEEGKMLQEEDVVKARWRPSDDEQPVTIIMLGNKSNCDSKLDQLKVEKANVDKVKMIFF